MALKITRLTAENYKRLRAVEISPSGNVVTIAGRNAQGKTSVLDAIWAALAGGEASRAVRQPIREGQDTAVVRLDLGEYIVTRRWTKNDSGTLTIEAPDGARYSSPQKLLDEVIGARAFDPLAFTRLGGKEQVKALTDLVDVGFDPARVEAERKGVFERRTEVNREVAKLEAQLKSFPDPDPELPSDEVSAAALLAEVEEAREHNARIGKVVDAGAAVRSRQERAREAFAAAEAELAAADAAMVAWRAEVDELPERIDINELGDRLAGIEVTNQRVREQKQRAVVESELHDRKNDAAALTLKLRQIDRDKADALARAEFPVDGLGFDESGVTYQGVPFSQASAAEQLRVSVALAMAANPTLRVLQIRDGSLLDEDSLRMIEDLAAENDYQVFLEVVGDSAVGVVIEDGAVVAVDGEAVA